MEETHNNFCTIYIETCVFPTRLHVKHIFLPDINLLRFYYHNFTVFDLSLELFCHLFCIYFSLNSQKVMMFGETELLWSNRIPSYAGYSTMLLFGHRKKFTNLRAGVFKTGKKNIWYSFVCSSFTTGYVDAYAHRYANWNVKFMGLTNIGNGFWMSI